jgi:hypothetical protein
MRSPGFTFISILVMALGIGATTSLFTIVRAVLLKPLPFVDSDKLVAVYEHFRESTDGDGFNVVAPGDFRDWRQQTHGFEDMAAWRGYGCPKLCRLQEALSISFRFSAFNRFWAVRSRRKKTDPRQITLSC